MRKKILVRPAAAIFVMRPILVSFGHPKAGMAFNLGKAPFGLGRGKVFLHRGPQERSIPDMVQCLLDNLNG
jgi:hypothetical protein